MTTLEQTLSRSDRGTRLDEIRSRIAEHGIRHVYLQYTSVPGRVMGKVIPAKHFDRIAESGLAWTYLSAGGFAGSLDGEAIGPSGAAATEGLLIPDLDTFQVQPWDDDVGRIYCDHYHRPDDPGRPGELALSDSRGNLKRVLAEFRESHGYEVRSGCEPEMSWFPSEDQVSAEVSHLPDHVSTAYHIGHIERIRPILKRVTEYGQAMGLDMIQADYEDPGQVEMNFMFGSALETADNLTTFRQICVQVAKELGVFATFMPKPLPGVMANGCHHHLSLWSDGDNAFAEPEGPELSEVGRRAVGGALAHSRGMSAISASTANSYARYSDVGLFAPTIPVWGYDNRLCTVRVLSGPRFEYRTPDACCNPYLTHAALIAAMRDGIDSEIDPGPPADPEEDVPAEEDSRFPLLPRTLGEALEALEADEVVRSVLPSDLFDTFMHVKRDEWRRACGAVTDWDRATYLRYLP
jgi:glutamine synthetase